jgi:hypothetical protein
MTTSRPLGLSALLIALGGRREVRQRQRETETEKERGRSPEGREWVLEVMIDITHDDEVALTVCREVDLGAGALDQEHIAHVRVLLLLLLQQSKERRRELLRDHNALRPNLLRQQASEHPCAGTDITDTVSLLETIRPQCLDNVWGVFLDLTRFAFKEPVRSGKLGGAALRVGVQKVCIDSLGEMRGIEHRWLLVDDVASRDRRMAYWKRRFPRGCPIPKKVYRTFPLWRLSGRSLVLLSIGMESGPIVAHREQSCRGRDRGESDDRSHRRV